MLRVVIDANVWVSALLNPGNARTIQELFEAGRFHLFAATEIMTEYSNVFSRTTFSARINPERKELLLNLIQEAARVVQLTGSLPQISRDPKDDIFLECAGVADCDYLVTGDKDLLVLQNYGRTTIVTPTQFLQILTTSQ